MFEEFEQDIEIGEQGPIIAGLLPPRQISEWYGASEIECSLLELVDNDKIELVFTTGGTGLGPKDLTPEATKKVIDKEVPGITEAIRNHGKERTPYAMLSRELAGVRNKSIIINLPGSSGGAKESMEALFPGLLHAYPMMWGGGHEKASLKDKEQSSK